MYFYCEIHAILNNVKIPIVRKKKVNFGLVTRNFCYKKWRFLVKTKHGKQYSESVVGKGIFPNSFNFGGWIMGKR